MIETDRAPVDPRKSPSYPQRVHLGERPRWQALLQAWDDRIASARQSLQDRGKGSDGAATDRLISQMLGARDQLADAVRRLPMEVGSLYEEDRHRAEEAVAALERLFRRWES